MTSRQMVRSALMAGAGVAVLAAVAATETLRVKTGLWEVTSTVQSSGMPPIDTSKLTPEQKQRLEAMMKAQSGAPKTMTRQECLTQEKLEKKLFSDDKDNCKRSAVTETAVLQEFKIECETKDQGQAVGTLRIQALSPESVKGAMTMKMAGSGNEMNMNSTFTAKWIGANCGDVK